LVHTIYTKKLAFMRVRGVLQGRLRGKQGFDALSLITGMRVRKTYGTSWAGGAAGAATQTQLVLDCDLLVLEIAADGAGRADIHACGAADLVVAAVGAQLLPVVDKLGLLALPHQIIGQAGLLSSGNKHGIAAEH
jgi:hypothetical protein